MVKILVAGFGNVLLGDEGVGVHLINQLATQDNYPPEVEFFAGGTSSLDLIAKLPDTAGLIIVDAMQNGGEPGSVYHLDSLENLPSTAKISVHEFDLSQTLALIDNLGYRLPIRIMGIEPASLSFSPNLSPTLQERVPEYLSVIDALIKEMAAHA